MKRFIAFMMVFAALSVTNVFADEQLSLATGNPKLTYSKMFANMAPFCPMVKEYTETTGGFDNLSLILTNKVNMGIVPEDVLEMAKRTDRNVEKNVRGLVALHYNALHIIVLKEGIATGGGGWFNKLGLGKEQRMVIQDLRDLKGKKVACFGSAIVTGEFLNERLQSGIQFVRVASLSEGAKMLQSGEVVALFATAGWPADFVDTLDPKVFTLASLDDAYAKKLGLPFYSLKLNYPKLEAMGVITVGARNIIAVRNYISATKVKEIMSFRQALVDNLQDIKEANGSHPSWGDVEDIEDFGWLKYDGAPPAKAKK